MRPCGVPGALARRIERLLERDEARVPQFFGATFARMHRPG